MSTVYWRFVDSDKKAVSANISDICYARLRRTDKEIISRSTYINLYMNQRYYLDENEPKDKLWWEFLGKVPFFKGLVKGLTIKQYNEEGVFIPIKECGAFDIFNKCTLFRYREEMHSVVKNFHKLKELFPTMHNFPLFLLAHKPRLIMPINSYCNNHHMFFDICTNILPERGLENLKWKHLMERWPEEKPFYENPDWFNSTKLTIFTLWRNATCGKEGTFEPSTKEEMFKRLFPNKWKNLIKRIDQ